MAKFKAKKKEGFIKNLKEDKVLEKGIRFQTFLKFKKSVGVNLKLPLKNFQSNHKIKKRYGFFLQKKNFLRGQEPLKKLKADLQYIRQISNYTYSRHKYKLPARGQRTRTNAKTQKKINLSPDFNK